ncbi:MAG: AmmeMemoRadiSam system protein B [Nitrososphaerales archaeon]
MASSSRTVRPPAVAGMFYPSDKDELFESIHRSFTHPLGPGRFPHGAAESGTKMVECLIVPHAGYAYSGPVAAHSYFIAQSFFASNVGRKVVVFILGPNHYGLGSGVAVSGSNSWITPLGSVHVNTDLATAIIRASSILDIDDTAHAKEHSIEVQLPFLQIVSSMREDWSFVPICMMLQDNETSKQVAESVFKVINTCTDESSVLVIGSSDLTHYEPHIQAMAKDLELLESVSEMDPLSFYNVLERLNVSSCGYGAIAATIYVSKMLGRKKGTILKYATSGDITGDRSSVVGYPSVHFD